MTEREQLVQQYAKKKVEHDKEEENLRKSIDCFT
jgi:hypothetical protein